MTQSLYDQWNLMSDSLEPQEHVFVFDCDKTLISGDLGEASLRLALQKRWIISHDAWWNHLEVAEISTAQERAQWRRAYEKEQVQLDDFRDDILSRELWTAYEVLCEQDITSAYIYAARLSYQRSSSEISTLALEALHLDSQVQERPLMCEFVTQIRECSGEVWIVSSSQIDIVKVIAQRYHIPVHQVIGVDFIRDEQGKSSDKLWTPTPIKEEKVSAFYQKNPHQPVLMTGDSWYDLPLMREARFGILIDHQNDPKLTQAAQELGVKLIHHQEVESFR